MKVQTVYSGESFIPEWLRKLAGEAGEVWIENRNGELVIIHEFTDLNQLRGKEILGVVIDEEIST